MNLDSSLQFGQWYGMLSRGMREKKFVCDGSEKDTVRDVAAEKKRYLGWSVKRSMTSVK